MTSEHISLLSVPNLLSGCASKQALPPAEEVRPSPTATPAQCKKKIESQPLKYGTDRRHLTIALNFCPSASCAGDTFDCLWPILVDARTGRCL